MRVQITKLQSILEGKLRAIGFSAADARIVVAEHLLGELKGKRSHGVYAFIREFEKLRTRPRGRFRIAKNKAAYAFIEGNRDLGQLVADKAIRLGMEKARKSGVAMVGGRNIHAFLRPGTWAEMAARKGFVALCFNYGGGPLIAAPGARESVISTNPIGIGIPNSPNPFVIDMAVSERAFFHIRLARELGKRIPSSWAIDQNGRPTTDSKKVVAAQPFGGYKGFALGLALELLTGPLVRTEVGKRTQNVRGFLFIVLNPNVFGSRDAFRRGVRGLLREVKTAKRIPGVREIAIPGDRSFRTEAINRKRGWIEVEQSIYEQIVGLKTVRD